MATPAEIETLKSAYQSALDALAAAPLKKRAAAQAAVDAAKSELDAAVASSSPEAATSDPASKEQAAADAAASKYTAAHGLGPVYDKDGTYLGEVTAADLERAGINPTPPPPGPASDPIVKEATTKQFVENGAGAVTGIKRGPAIDPSFDMGGASEFGGPPTQAIPVDPTDMAGFSEFGGAPTPPQPVKKADPVDPVEAGLDPVYVAPESVTPPVATLDLTAPGGSPLADMFMAGVKKAQKQPAIATQIGNDATNGDWRVKLSLAKGASYLYNDPQPGILQPLKPTGGVIFPYTPKIDIIYKANYQNYDPTHSNFRGYYYQNSQVGDIGITAHFTAQDTMQANYLLAVIHFFRSATKMFYGQDAQRGAPPPLLFLTGLGQYQFNNHPCLLTEFSYTLPEDVDYIRAQSTNQANLNLTNQNSVKQAVPTNNIFASLGRLANAFATKGALPVTPFGTGQPQTAPNLAKGSPTYVPTKIDISIRLLPVNTRQQVSQQFSLQKFANGQGLSGGFW